MIALILAALVLTAGESLSGLVPELALQVAAFAAGAGLLRLYTVVVRLRWQADGPDAGGLLANDLVSVFDWGSDHRLSFPPRWPLPDRILYEILYVLKWVGHLLVFIGAGTFMYGLMLRFGIVGS